MQVKTFPIVLEKAFMITPSVKHFVFRCQEDEVFDFIPGQFITIHFEHETKTLRRSYSIANAPTQNNIIEFAAGFIEGGPGTQLLFNLKEGEAIHINGPFGRLILKESAPKRYILVATSTGITPYRAMLPELKKQLHTNPDLNIVILQGVQRREDILYNEELKAFAHNFSRVQYRSYLSRQPADDLQTGEYKGYVQHAFSELDLNPEDDMVYLCGNPSMIDDAFNILKEQNFTVQQIVREKYISR